MPRRLLLESEYVFDIRRGFDAGAREAVLEPRFEAFAPPTGGTANNGLPILDWDQGAAQLNRGGFSWSAIPAAATTVTYAFRASTTLAELAGLPPGVSGFSPFNAIQIAVTEEILRLWSEVANITFVRAGTGTSGAAAYSDNASILFGNFNSGPPQFSALTYLPSPDGTAPSALEGNIWVNVSRDYDADPAAFPLGAHILAHEIGHALGLLHPGDYGGGANGGATYGADAEYWQDTAMFTNMTYFSEAFTGGAYGTLAITPQLHDIAAAQMLYGVNTTTRTGNTVYGFNSNAGHATLNIAGSTSAATFTIWDAGGEDTLDLSGYLTAVEIDLREEAFSSAGPGPGIGLAHGNIAIARNVVIENAIGGVGADTLIGNAASNRLDGGAGADTMAGGLGNDTYVVDSALDVTTELEGGGVDTVHSSISWSLFEEVENLTLTGAAAINGTGNTLANVITGNGAANVLVGLGGDDSLFGNAGDDTLNGGADDDILDGGAGADALNGGAGGDTADYSTAAARVVVRLWSNSGSEGDAAGDTLTSVENVSGGAGGDTIAGDSLGNVLVGGGGVDFINGLDGDDTLRGDAGADVLLGGVGADSLEGGADNDSLNGGVGADALVGGAGSDTADYSTAAARVAVRLWSNSGSEGDAAGDTLFGVENATGGAGGDTIAGDSLANVLAGGGGADFLNGLDGNDTLRGDAGADALVGGAGADSLEGGADNDTLNGGAGADTINGGAGADTADYSAATARVAVRLWSNSGAEGDATGDTLSGVENVTGGGGGDTIAGDSFVNVLAGGGGADFLNGLDGNDTLRGDAGADVLVGGAGADAFVFSVGGGADQVNDFDADAAGGQDALNIAAFGITALDFSARVSIADQGANTLVTIDGAATMLLLGVTGDGDNIITQSDFILGG